MCDELKLSGKWNLPTLYVQAFGVLQPSVRFGHVGPSGSDTGKFGRTQYAGVSFCTIGPVAWRGAMFWQAICLFAGGPKGLDHTAKKEEV